MSEENYQIDASLTAAQVAKAKQSKPYEIDLNPCEVNVYTLNLPIYTDVPDAHEKFAVMGLTAALLERCGVKPVTVAHWLKINAVRLPRLVDSGILKCVTPLFKRLAHLNADWFLKYRQPAYIRLSDRLCIEELLHSKQSSAQIAKETHTQRPQISNLRHGKRKVANLSLETASKLISYYWSHRTWLARGELEKLLFNYHVLVRRDRQHPGIRVTGENGNYVFAIYVPDDPKQAGFLMDDYTPDVTPREAFRAVKLYAKVPPKKRAWSATEYMLKDLGERDLLKA